MNRKEVYLDIQETLGIIPRMFKCLPDSMLEEEWHLFRRTNLEKGSIPGKYRALIGLGISASLHSRYGVCLNAEMAKANGATAEEIDDALHFTKTSMGWNAYFDVVQPEYEQFKNEVLEICRHIRSSHAQVAEKRIA